MNLPPRQQQILELVRDRGYVSIEEMATLFVVTHKPSAAISISWRK